MEGPFRPAAQGAGTDRLAAPFGGPVAGSPDGGLFEWTTPTGAALLAAFASGSAPPPFRVLGIGQGAGRLRPPSGHGTLRLLLGREC